MWSDHAVVLPKTYFLSKISSGNASWGNISERNDSVKKGSLNQAQFHVTLVSLPISDCLMYRNNQFVPVMWFQLNHYAWEYLKVTARVVSLKLSHTPFWDDQWRKLNPQDIFKNAESFCVSFIRTYTLKVAHCQGEFFCLSVKNTGSIPILVVLLECQRSIFIFDRSFERCERGTKWEEALTSVDYRLFI